jgi:hypothetical protein
MTKTFTTLATYMGWLANIGIYESWSGDFIKKELFSAFEHAKKEFAVNYEDLNFKELTSQELKLLRFADFDDNTKNLIPLWLFRVLPDDIKLESFRGETCLKKDADDDIRFGCTVYRFPTL